MRKTKKICSYLGISNVKIVFSHLLEDGGLQVEVLDNAAWKKRSLTINPFFHKRKKLIDEKKYVAKNVK